MLPHFQIVGCAFPDRLSSQIRDRDRQSPCKPPYHAMPTFDTRLALCSEKAAKQDLHIYIYVCVCVYVHVFMIIYPILVTS